jgi:hypothetical protein
MTTKCKESKEAEECTQVYEARQTKTKTKREYGNDAINDEHHSNNETGQYRQGDGAVDMIHDVMTRRRERTK